jgi:glyoxylase-like metal-dependent hydrolase (beta-lactamase superfamily II)
MKTSYQPKYFNLQQLADGMYAALAVPGSGAWSNAGIVDLGGQTLVFDTLFTPQAAQELRRYAEQLTGRPATWVINSHRHADHILGNQVFADAQIVATSTTREKMAERSAAFIAHAKADTTFLAEFAAQIDREPDERTRARMINTLANYRALEQALPTIELTLPNVTFTERMTFHGTQRAAELITYGGAHSLSDAFLYLPEDKIMFAGDIVQVQTHPSMSDGNPEQWDVILKQVAMLDIERIVPGHGPLGGREDLDLTRQYIHDLQHHAAAAVERGLSAEQAGALDVLAQFEEWDAPMIFHENMRFLHKRLSKARL